MHLDTETTGTDRREQKKVNNNVLELFRRLMCGLLKLLQSFNFAFEDSLKSASF